MTKNISKEERLTELAFCSNILKKYSIKFNSDRVLWTSRVTELVFHRALIALILNTRGYSLSYIGSVINKDHATAINLLKYDEKYHFLNDDYNKVKKDVIKDVIAYNKINDNFPAKRSELLNKINSLQKEISILRKILRNG